MSVVYIVTSLLWSALLMNLFDSVGGTSMVIEVVKIDIIILDVFGCHFFIISLFHSISFLMQCKIVLTDGGSAQMLRYKQDHDIELVTAHYNNLWCLQTSCFVWLHSFLLRQRFCVRSFFSPRHRQHTQKSSNPSIYQKRASSTSQQTDGKKIGLQCFLKHRASYKYYYNVVYYSHLHVATWQHALEWLETFWHNSLCLGFRAPKPRNRNHEQQERGLHGLYAALFVKAAPGRDRSIKLWKAMGRIECFQTIHQHVYIVYIYIFNIHIYILYNIQLRKYNYDLVVLCGTLICSVVWLLFKISAPSLYLALWPQAKTAW